MNDRIILVIDDDLKFPNQAAVFSSSYPIEGFSYQFAADETEAVGLIRENPDSVALILLDIRFEGISPTYGLEILSYLVEKGYSVPIVMLSSVTDANVIISAWKKGAKTYLIKWAENDNFYGDLKEIVADYALSGGVRDKDFVKMKRKKILNDTEILLKKHGTYNLNEVIDAANRLKQEISSDWQHSIPFPDNFENYIKGWNASEDELKEANENSKLLYLNMDFGDGCMLNCPHCFTREGAIDDRGRTPLAYGRLKEQIIEAKTLGLKAIRILGRGEPTQWITSKNRYGPEKGTDFIDFITFLRQQDIIPLIFTRGQILGDDRSITRFYNGAHGVKTGDDLARLFRDLDVSVFLGFSSLFPEINNEMVGRGEQQDYDQICRNALKLLVKYGFNMNNPTHLAVEAPITNLNIHDMLVRFVFFQMLNISPCSNVYMVTGRAMTYRLGELTDPGQEAFLEMYAAITHFMRLMGIKGRIGSYAGTKECHDIQYGMYLTLNGEIYPCPGYEGIHNYVGSLTTHSITDIWKNNPYARHPQSICPPKIATHFPPDFENLVEERIHITASRYDEIFSSICKGLGINI